MTLRRDIPVPSGYAWATFRGYIDAHIVEIEYRRREDDRSIVDWESPWKSICGLTLHGSPTLFMSRQFIHEPEHPDCRHCMKKHP